MTTELGRMLRFAVVGLVNTALTVLCFFLLSTTLGVAAPPASALAFAVGAVNGYVWNRRWTFNYGAEQSGPATMGRYLVVQLFGAVLSGFGVWLASHGLAAPHLLAELVVVPVATLTTYTLCRTLVFAPPTLTLER